MKKDIKTLRDAAELSSKNLDQDKLHVPPATSINAKAGKNTINASEEALRKLNLPFSEADMLKGLDAHFAHADELAQLLPSEIST